MGRGGGGRGDRGEGMTNASGAESLFRKLLGGAPRATKLSPSGGQTERCREIASRSHRRRWARRCCYCCWFTPTFQVGAKVPGPLGWGLGSVGGERRGEERGRELRI